MSHNFSSKEQASFNFMAAVTICSDFGAQENKICHCFHFFFYNPTSEVTVAALCTTRAQKPATPNISPKTRAVQKGQVPPAASGPWATARLMSSLLFPAIGLPRGKQKKHVCDCTGIVLKGCSAWEHPPSWRLFMRKIKAIIREYVPHSNFIN